MAREQIIPARPDGTSLTGPVRTCIGCRERTAKSELLRVTVGSDTIGHQVVVPDPLGTAPGRGAHLHPTTECYELAARRKAFGRALRVPTGLDSAAVGAYVGSAQHPAGPETRHNEKKAGAAAHEHSMSTDR